MEANMEHLQVGPAVTTEGPWTRKEGREADQVFEFYFGKIYVTKLTLCTCKNMHMHDMHVCACI